MAYGGSAGGMLVGAVANMRPDLWGGIIGAVPFVDVLNTISDASLPLTPPEWPEWGNPLKDAAAYDVIAGYSAYDNVAARPYPPILATGGLSDPRVTYWEPAKWVAKLRENTTADAPILLKINMEAGHGGASGRFDFLKEIALDYAFAIWAVGRGRGRGRRRLDRPLGHRSGRCGVRGDLRPPCPARLWHVRGSPAAAPSMAQRIAAVQVRGLPYLVAEDDGRIVGFAYAAPFRPRAAYRYTAEDSIYIHPDFLGRGIGKALVGRSLSSASGLAFGRWWR